MKPATECGCEYRWLKTGDEAFAAMLRAIGEARQIVRLETYIFAPGTLAERFRLALIEAALRGVRVLVMVDAWGSYDLRSDFWEPLVQAGGSFRWFNRLSLGHISFRNHRKQLNCDEKFAIIGGFNIAPEYEGDGINRGWRDVGLQINGPLAADLAINFDQLFANSDFKHGIFMRLRRAIAPREIKSYQCDILLSNPGRGGSSLKLAMIHSLLRANAIDIIAAYFLPPIRLRRALQRAARHGRRVRLILPAKSDVPLLRLASQGLYQPLLRAGVEIYEYQPQILHAKLVIADDTVFCGSANLDPRSFHINYELMLCLTNSQLAEEGRVYFEETLAHSRRIEPGEWKKSRGYWDKLRERWARFLFAQVDTAFARRQLRYLK